MLGAAIRGVRQSIKQVQKAFAPRSFILMYHRVAEEGIDPWSLCVTPQHFAEQLEVLQQHLRPMTLQHLALSHAKGELPDRAVTITFDDGYANNLVQAKPILEQKQIPASVFVTTGYLGQEREYWWDELEQVLLTPGSLPSRISLEVGTEEKFWVLGGAAQYSPEAYQKDIGLNVWDSQVSDRMKFYYGLWSSLQPLTEENRQQCLREIYSWAGMSPTQRESHRPMTVAEVSILESGGLVEVGAHTVHHPMLQTQSVVEQQAEIAQSKSRLEAILGHPVHSFAYPFGTYQQETIALVEDAGFNCACTTVEESVWPGDRRFQLPRFEVRNWSGDEFEKRLLRWLRNG
jgi:peptidoglycan/xylan/chitin deacetylase (PgdA/CDA1 family)